MEHQEHQEQAVLMVLVVPQEQQVLQVRLVLQVQAVLQQ